MTQYYATILNEKFLSLYAPTLHDEGTWSWMQYSKSMGFKIGLFASPIHSSKKKIIISKEIFV